MYKRIAVVLACFSLTLAAGPVQAATMISGDFSIGMGYVSPGVWDTSETSTGNTAPTGPFTVTPSPTGPTFDLKGPTFTDRVLASGGETSYSGMLRSAAGADATVPILASYTGAAPGDAAATPNYQLTLVIDSLKVWAGQYTGYSPTEMGWAETTAGHESSQTPVDLSPLGTAYDQASYYHTQLVWNPDDYAVALTGGLNSSITRTFDFVPVLTSEDVRAIDGMEFYGHVELSYDAVPEPSTLALVTMGLIGLLCYAWRKRK